MPELLRHAEAAAQSHAAAQEKLVHRDKLLVQNQEQSAALQRSNLTAQDQVSHMRALLSKIDGGRTVQREARAAAGGRVEVFKAEDTMQALSDAVRGNVYVLIHEYGSLTLPLPLT